MRRIKRFGWVFALLLLMGVVGWIIYWGYEIKLRNDWEYRAGVLVKRLERSLLDTQLQLGVLAEAIAPQLTAGSSSEIARSIASNSLIKRLNVSEVVLHRPSEDRVLYSESPRAHEKLWRASMFDFWRTANPQSAVELTEYGPRVLDIEPLKIGDEICGLEVAVDLQRFIENFSKREGVDAAFLVQDGHEGSTSLPTIETDSNTKYKILSSTGNGVLSVLQQPQIRGHIGKNSLGMIFAAGSAYATLLLNNIEYHSELAPAFSGASALVMWVDMSEAVAALSAERKMALCLAWAIIGSIGGFWIFFFDRFRGRMRFHLLAAQDSLKVANQKLKAEVASRQHTEENLRSIADEIYSGRQLDIALLESLAHQLKLNASASLGFSELLRKESSEIKDKESLEALHLLGEHLFTLADNLSLWAMREAHKKKPSLNPVPLKPAIADALKPLSMYAERKKIRVLVDVDKGFQVKADTLLLDGAFRNIIFNSLKYTPNGGELSISARAVEGGVELAFSDNGIGISRPVMESLFSRIQKRTERGLEGEEGLGLGMLLVKWVAEKHEASLRVISDEGVGCKVVWVFPDVKTAKY